MRGYLVCMAALLLASALAPSAGAQELRLGMVGLDTSHVTAFTEVMNDPNHPKHVPGAKVVVAVKGGSPDIESSASRVDGFTKEMTEKWGVEMVGTVEELAAKVDGIMIQSIDGRTHLAQAIPAIKSGKPVFIDKPFAGTLTDVIKIVRHAKEKNVPLFSSSSYRYYDGMVALKAQDVGDIRGAISYGPAHLEKTHPDLFWYGVHPAEALFTIMGPECLQVVRTATPDTDVVTGIWSGARVGTLLGLRNMATPHKVTVFGTKAVAEQQETGGDYSPLVAEIVKFFQTKVSPVPPEETLAIFAFMEAADESKRRGGAPVAIEEVLRMHEPKP